MQRRQGFTLIELLVVMAIIATLLSIALPRYLGAVDKAKEATLRSTLSEMRSAIDKFHADQARYPDSLEDLVRLRYVRAIPVDPMTDSASTWTVARPPESAVTKGQVFDIHSGSSAKALDGTEVASW